jgi:hypothetical protein
MSEARDNGTIQRADPQYRRRMQRWLVVCSIAGVILLVGLVGWLSQLTQVMSQGDVATYQRWLQRLMAGICLLLAAAAAGFAFWLQRLAGATKAERRWPPASMPTSADMRIRYLTSADALVTQLQAGAWGLFAFAFALAAWAAWLLWPH